MTTMLLCCDEKIETQEGLMSKTRMVIQGLEALKSEYDFMLHNLAETIKCLNDDEKAGLVHEKFSLLQTSVEAIQLGVEEAKVMTALAAYLGELESEKRELGFQVCQLELDNMQLKEQVDYVLEKLITSEQNLAQVEVEKNQLEFMNELKQYNPEPFLEDGDDEETSRNNLDELFPNEEETTQEAPSLQETNMTRAAAQQGSNNVPDHLKILHNLVIQYAQKGRYEVAVPLCKQHLESLERTLGHDHPDVATMLSVLALVYRDKGNFEEASRLLYDVVAIRMKTLGEDHPLVATALNNLSVQYGKMGKYIEAEPLCKRALELKEKVLGTDHPDVAKQLNNLAVICEKQEKYEDVENYYCRVIAIYEKNLCQDDHNVDKTKNNLASCYLKQGKYKEAEFLYKEILTRAHQKEFGTVDGEIESIWIYAEEGRGVAAIDSHYAEHSEGQVPSFVRSPSINSAVLKLAEVYRYQGKNKAADIMEEFVMRPRKQPSVAIVQPLKDVDESRRSSLYCVKYEPRDDGFVAWNGNGILRRSGSLSKLGEVIRRSSAMLVKQLQDKVLQDSPNPNLKRAESLNFLNRSGDLQSGRSGRRLKDTRPRSSSTVELHNNTK